MFCRGCGYVLRGLAHPSCPECGRAFDPQDAVTFAHRDPRITQRRRCVFAAAILLAGVGLWGLRLALQETPQQAMRRLERRLDDMHMDSVRDYTNDPVLSRRLAQGMADGFAFATRHPNTNAGCTLCPPDKRAMAYQAGYDAGLRAGGGNGGRTGPRTELLHRIDRVIPAWRRCTPQPSRWDLSAEADQP